MTALGGYRPQNMGAGPAPSGCSPRHEVFRARIELAKDPVSVPVQVARCRVGDDLPSDRVPCPDVAAADVADNESGEEGISVGSAERLRADDLLAPRRWPGSGG